MKRKPYTIAYNKMYLVTPMVYEKLKNCLNKTDISNLTTINKPFFMPTLPPGNPQYPPYPFGKLDESDDKYKTTKYTPPFTDPPKSEMSEFEHPKPEMWEEEYFPRYEEPESDIAQMSIDDEPINWDENIQDILVNPVRTEEIGIQTEFPATQQISSETQTESPYTTFAATQTEPQPYTLSQGSQTTEQPKTSQKTQTSNVKKTRIKKKKHDDTSQYNTPPPPPPPPPPSGASSLVQFIPTSIQQSEEFKEKKKIKVKKPAKSLELERQMNLPIKQKSRNIQNIDLQSRLAKHFEHFGMPVARAQSRQLVPSNPPQSESRALVPFIPQSGVPQIAGITSNIPLLNIDEEYITPIPQPELVYRQPPSVTYENRPEIQYNQPRAVEYREPLRLEYKPSPPRPLKTYSRPVKRKSQNDDSTDIDIPASKTLILRKTKKRENIDLPKTYQKTKIPPPSFETYDGKMRVKIKPPQHLKVIDESQEDETSEPTKVQTPKFLCDVCGLTLSSAYNLARHKERELKRMNRETDRENQFKMWFNDDRGGQTKRTSTDAKFVPRQDKKRTAKDDFERWNK